MRTTISNHTIEYTWEDNADRPLSEENCIEIHIALANEKTEGVIIHLDLMTDKTISCNWKAYANNNFLLNLEDWG